MSIVFSTPVGVSIVILVAHFEGRSVARWALLRIKTRRTGCCGVVVHNDDEEEQAVNV